MFLDGALLTCAEDGLLCNDQQLAAVVVWCEAHSVQMYATS